MRFVIRKINFTRRDLKFDKFFRKSKNIQKNKNYTKLLFREISKKINYIKIRIIFYIYVKEIKLLKTFMNMNIKILKKLF